VEGIDQILKQILDTLASVESNQSKATESMVALGRKTNDASTRLLKLGSALPPQPYQQQPPRPPQAWINPFNMNMAPGDGTRPSASASK
jgi:hypothetical protein